MPHSNFGPRDSDKGLKDLTCIWGFLIKLIRLD